MLCTLWTLNSGSGADSGAAPAAALAAAEDAFAGEIVPIICTRLPLHGVKSVPVNRYVAPDSLAIEPDVPAGVGMALPVVAVAAVALLPLPAG
jgi:hypothetical protein